jgi:hypothetical protein
MAAERTCIMVWDGLRPDRVSPQVTPTLWQLANSGVWFERSYAVYPTLTRANSPAISTGCRPGRAGVPGNTICLPGADGALAPYTTGDATTLQRLADADGQPILLVDTLADRVHRAGGRTVVVGSGSPGSAWLQHPRASDCGDLVIAEGIPVMAPVLDQVRQRFGPLPTRALPASAWTAAFTRMITDWIIPEITPTLLVFWHTDPDHTQHALGLGAPETIQSLRDADAHLAAILDCYERLGLRSTTDVIVTSDHGGSSITRRARPADDLGALDRGSTTVENGGSTFVYGSQPGTIATIRGLDYAGPIFTRDGREQTCPLSLVGLDGPRTPDIVFSFRWMEEAVDGVPGASVGTDSKLAVDHGTLSPYDLHNTLVAQGPDFRVGWRNPAPAGNIDIAPTLTHLLGLDPGTPFDGRVLAEALATSGPTPPEAPAWQSSTTSMPYTVAGRDWQQHLWFEQIDGHRYLTGGTVEPAG